MRNSMNGNGTRPRANGGRATTAKPDLRELGSARGRTRTFDGRTYDEWIPELSGPQAFRTYEDMANNDPVIGGILFAIEQLVRNVKWYVRPFSSRNKHVKAAQFLDECRNDMSDTWEDFVVEALSMLTHGWSWHEQIYKFRRGDNRDPKQRSKYNDGLIGWRKWPIRSQDTLTRWEFQADGDGIKGMVQGYGSDEVLIPIEKSLHFRTRPNRRHPEGRSILRTAYRSWYFKRRMEEIEGIGIERELAGLPVLKSPEDLDIWDPDDERMEEVREFAQDIVANVRENEAEGVIIPGGWDFQLASAGGQRAIDVSAVIERYDRRMAMSMEADFILIGHESVGSHSLADTKTSMFAYSVGALLDIIKNVVNRYAVKRLFELNPRFPQDELPTVEHGDTETPDLSALAGYVTSLTGSGVIIPGPELEDHMRAIAGLPEKPDEMKEWDQRAIDPLERELPIQPGAEEEEKPVGDDQKPSLDPAKRNGATPRQSNTSGAPKPSPSSNVNGRVR